MQRAEMVQKHNGRHILEQNIWSFFLVIIAMLLEVVPVASPA